MDPTWPAFPILAFISFILVLIPLPWHLEALNTGTVLYMLWAGVATLNQFINSILWHNNVINWAPVWCDISIRIITGAAVGIPASSLCIMRRLYKISSIQAVTITKQERRRTILIDLGIALGFPLFAIFLQYICSGHRANIFEDYGCTPVTYNSVAAYFLVYQWPVTIGVCSMVYCSLILYTFATRRAQFNEFLSSHRSFNFSRYFRLMALAGLEMCVTVPLGILVIYINCRQAPLRPWISWYNVHVNFSRVELYPRVLWEKNYWLKFGLDCTRWLTILCGYVFFFWFGFAEEARKNYRSAFWTVVQKFGYTQKLGSTYVNSSSNGGSKPKGTLTSSIGTSTLPEFKRSRGNKTGTKRDSLFSSMGEVYTVTVDVDVVTEFEKEKDLERRQSSSSGDVTMAGAETPRAVTTPSDLRTSLLGDADHNAVPRSPPPAFDAPHNTSQNGNTPNFVDMV